MHYVSSTAVHLRWLLFCLLNAVLIQASEPFAYLSLTGTVADSSCRFDTLGATAKALEEDLKNLTATDFFRHWRVDLYKDCPFWQDNSLCYMRDCAVETCDANAVPEICKEEPLSQVHFGPTKKDQPFLDACQTSDKDFCERELPLDGGSTEFVNLLQNPEQYTGYHGADAHKVWRAIYNENCFDGLGGVSALENADPNHPEVNAFIKMARGIAPAPNLTPPEDQCLERRAFQRIISGMHASISTHLCQKYMFKETMTWGPNLACYEERVGSHPTRIHNLHFLYLLLLRALKQSLPYLKSYQRCSPTSGTNVDTALHRIDRYLQKQTSTTTEAADRMFGTSEGIQLEREFKSHFRNISRIMDCVGCEKCRLWGKLQITGIGTALKILFSYREEGEKSSTDYRLQNNEVVAFVNTFHQVSQSIVAMDTFKAMRQPAQTLPKVTSIPLEKSKPASLASLPSLITQWWISARPSSLSSLSKWLLAPLLVLMASFLLYYRQSVKSKIKKQ